MAYACNYRCTKRYYNIVIIFLLCEQNNDEKVESVSKI